MKAITGLWFITMVMGLWLLFAQPTQAFDIRSCHRLQSNDAYLRTIYPQAILYSLSEAALSQLLQPMASPLDSPNDWSIECFRLPAGRNCSLS